MSCICDILTCILDVYVISWIIFPTLDLFLKSDLKTSLPGWICVVLINQLSYLTESFVVVFFSNFSKSAINFTKWHKLFSSVFTM